jgi:hypothetical protein
LDTYSTFIDARLQVWGVFGAAGVAVVSVFDVRRANFIDFTSFVVAGVRVFEIALEFEEVESETEVGEEFVRVAAVES